VRVNRKTLGAIIGSFIVLDVIAIAVVVTYFMKPSSTIEGDAAIVRVSEQDRLRPLYPLPEFSFTDQSGKPFSSSTMAGKVWVCCVFFTSCSGPCPVMTKSMGDLASEYTSEQGVHFVNFTVDPETDTPERLTEYAKRYDADHSKWSFVTWHEEPVLQNFYVEGLKLGSGDTPLIHSEYFLLVDQQGMVRGYFTGTNPQELAELRKAIATLLAEK